MTSRFSAPRPGTEVNGSFKGSQPKPHSLIAAHLAPSNGSTLPHFNREDFELLLTEVLGSDEDGQPNLGTDVTINHELICVVIKAGLDPIFRPNDNPFCEHDHCLDSIQKCIQAIDLSIDRTPAVLFIPPKSEGLGQESGNVPLFSWIVPRLLSLLAYDKDHSISIPHIVWSLVEKIMAAEHQCSNSLSHCLSISSYIDDLIEGITNSMA